MTPRPSPEEVDAACAVLVPGGGLSRADVVAALEAAAGVREAAERQSSEAQTRHEAALRRGAEDAYRRLNEAWQRALEDESRISAAAPSRVLERPDMPSGPSRFDQMLVDPDEYFEDARRRALESFQREGLA